MALEQYAKSTGTNLFIDNRTSYPTELSFDNNGEYEYSGKLVTTVATPQYVYNHKKSDIYIQPGTSGRFDDKGFLILNSSCAISYDSVEYGTGPEGVGNACFASFGVPTGLLNNYDKIYLGSDIITLRTDVATDYTLNIININSSDINTQISYILNFFNSKRTSYPVPMYLNFNYYQTYKTVSNKIASFTIVGCFLNTSLDNYPFGISSTNTSVVVTASSTSTVARIQIQSLLYVAKTAGYPGNEISITYSSSGSTTASATGNQISIGVSPSTTALDIVNTILASPAVDALVSATVIGSNNSTIQATPVNQTFLRSGSSTSTIPWKRCDTLKNCFIIPPKKMVGIRSSVCAPGTYQPNTQIPANTALYAAYNVTQILSSPDYNYGIWYRKNVALKATLKIHESLLNTFEVEALAPGTSGNNLTFQVAQDLSDRSIPALFSLSGTAITLTLGTLPPSYNSPIATQPITTINELYTALNHQDSNPLVKTLIKFRMIGAGQAISSSIPVRSLSGGTNSEEEGKFYNCVYDTRVGGIRYNNYGSYDVASELNYNGTSKVIQYTNYSQSGKFGGLFLRYTPENTAFFSRLYKKDILFTAKSAGTPGNGISIEYTQNISPGVSVSVSSLKITLAIQNTITQANDIKTAIESNPSANSLVSVKIVGVPEATQGIFAETFLTGGSAGLPTPSGYFACPRMQDYLSGPGYKYFDIFYASDFNNPNTFKYVVTLNATQSKGQTGPYTQYADREVISITDYFDINGYGIHFEIKNYSTTFETIYEYFNLYEKPASVSLKGTLITSLASDKFLGNEVKMKYLIGGVKGSEQFFVDTLTNGDTLITVQFSGGLSTIGDIITALANYPTASSLITISADSGYTNLSTLSNATEEKYLAGGMAIHKEAGYFGFGYCKMNAKEVSINGNPSNRRITPDSIPDYLYIESLRLTNLG